MGARDLMVLATAVVFVGCGATGTDELPYLGQPVPGFTPERFAPGIVSTDAALEGR
jgi:hypothetical protein